MEEIKKIRGCVGKLFQPRERDIQEIKKMLEEEEGEEEDEGEMGLELQNVKMPQFQRLDKGF